MFISIFFVWNNLKTEEHWSHNNCTIGWNLEVCYIIKKLCLLADFNKIDCVDFESGFIHQYFPFTLAYFRIYGTHGCIWKVV